LTEFGSTLIYVCNADGSDERVVRTEAHAVLLLRPFFNPADATEILFTLYENGKSSVEAVNSQHLGERTLIAPFGLQQRVRFAPDGKHILYAAIEKPIDLTKLGQPDQCLNLYRANSDGSGIEKLTNAPPYSGFFEPTISPDGKTIIFAGVELPR
jgi:hypothetical protein